ncbi:unnamed protein product, partial [Brenthis ino]
MADSDASADTDASIGRKRTAARPPLAGSTGSETETDERVRAKENKARRGRPIGSGRGTVLTRARAQLRNMEAEAREREFERALEARAFRKKPEKADKAGKAVFEFGSDLSASESREEGISARDVQGLRAEAGRSVTEILHVARTSGNLKGEYVRRLKLAAEALTGIVDALADRSSNEETRKVAADNERLRKEVENLKAEAYQLGADYFTINTIGMTFVVVVRRSYSYLQPVTENFLTEQIQ